jgi:hypothetical protein
MKTFIRSMLMVLFAGFLTTAVFAVDNTTTPAPATDPQTQMQTQDPAAAPAVTQEKKTVHHKAVKRHTHGTCHCKKDQRHCKCKKHCTKKHKHAEANEPTDQQSAAEEPSNQKLAQAAPQPTDGDVAEAEVSEDEQPSTI